jgi:chromosome segregation ATPase
MHENHHHSKNKNENKLALSMEKTQEIEKLRQREQELKKTIHEQLAYIIKMEEDLREVKSRNSDLRSKNELILNELEIIKIEFNNLSENLKNKKLSKNVLLIN